VVVSNSPALFSERIKDRHRRWWIEKEAVEFKNVGGKLSGRAFAEALGCRIPALHSLVDDPRAIPAFDCLPPCFVIKPNRGWSSKNVFAMDHGVNLLDGMSWSRAQIVDRLCSDPQSSGLRYLVEEFLINWDGKPGIPLDYKYFTFGDRIALIHVIERNSGANLKANRHWYVTEQWEPLGHRLVVSQTPERSIPSRPDCLGEMTEAVRRMGRKLNMFMRIDMYATAQGAVFGEFTPQPHGGQGFTSWADEWLGDMWKGLEGCG
jgi:hypothetical protein